MPCPNAQLSNESVGIGSNRSAYIPRPSSTQDYHLSMYVYSFGLAITRCSPWKPNRYEFIGRLIAVAMRCKTPLPLTLPSTIWKPIISELPLNLHDLKGSTPVNFCFSYEHSHFWSFEKCMSAPLSVCSGIDQFCGQALDVLRNAATSGLNEQNFDQVIFENFTTVLSDGAEVPLKVLWIFLLTNVPPGSVSHANILIIMGCV